MPISNISKMDVRQLFSELLGDGLMQVILRHAERQRKQNRENWRPLRSSGGVFFFESPGCWQTPFPQGSRKINSPSRRESFFSRFFDPPLNHTGICCVVKAPPPQPTPSAGGLP
jgi:hypothetical protein